MREIIEINEALIKLEIDTEKNIIKLLKFFLYETPLILDVEINGNNINELLCLFKEFYQLLENLMGKSELFPKLMSTIFYNEYMKVSEPDLRNELLNIIISKDDFLYNCFPLFKKIIKNIGISTKPKKIKDNFGLIEEEKNRMIRYLNKKKSNVLDQMILEILEHFCIEYFDTLNKSIDKDDKKYFMKYFEKKENKNTNYKNYIIFDLSLEIFDLCIKKLYDIFNVHNLNEEKKNDFNNLNKLYVIAYIKTYLSKFIELIGNFNDFEIDFILNKISKENNLMKVIKIYILKIFYNSKNRNWDDFYKGYITQKEVFSKILYVNETEENLYFLTNYFMPSNNYDEEIFKVYTDNFISIINKENENSQKFNEELIKNIDIFLIVTINNIISNLFFRNYLYNAKHNNNYTILCKYCDKAFRSLNANLRNLLNLFFNKEKFLKILKPIFESQQKYIYLKGEPYESLLYGFRFCVQTLLKLNSKDNNEKFTYASIISENSLDNINKILIPGNALEKNRVLDLFNLLEDIVNKSPGDMGNYVCSCGYFYSIGPSGFPIKGYTKKCPFCSKDIGYGPKVIKDKGYHAHGMVVRPGHYRIFKNMEQKKQQMSRFGDPDENIPNRTLKQYKEEVIKPLKYSCKKGITLLDKEDFLDEKKSVRNLSPISYRLLNFILYNHLFFANCLEYIDDENLKQQYLIKNLNCLEMIQINWNLIEKQLKEINIFSIQAFMNLIFKELSELISNLKIINTLDELIQFEEKVEKIVKYNIGEYPNYYDNYLRMNKDYFPINETDIKTILNEKMEPLEEIYSEKEFPFYKYFIYTEYNPDFEEALKQQENYLMKYPLLAQYINLTEEQKNIKYLPAFNEFTNFMVEKYSYIITREEAKQKKLSETESYDEKRFKAFKNAWDNIYKYAIKYKCRDYMNPKQLNSDDKLIYFLNDNNEFGYGMYLAAACQNFIKWQNDFLSSILVSADLNGNFQLYIENLKKKIPVQEANPNQILSFDDCFKNSDYKDFNDLVNTFTKRDIYGKDKINYHKYNKFIFDFSAIEEELAKLLLPGKCLFENEDKLNFMIFWGEGFRGNQSEIIQKFYYKYPQIELNDEQKEKLYHDIYNLYEDKKYNFKLFFGSMLLLISFLSNNNFSSDKYLSTIIKEKPDYLNLEEKCSSFFLYNEIKINQFMSIFFYVEHLSFKELSKTLKSEYKKQIDEGIIKKINAKLKDKKENEKLPWIEIAAAVRRFISRYLIGEIQSKDINEDEKLIFQLHRADLWEEKYGELEYLEDLITEKISEFNLKVGQALEFYEIIGDEDKNSIILKEYNKVIIPDDQIGIPDEEIVNDRDDISDDEVLE